MMRTIRTMAFIAGMSLLPVSLLHGQLVVSPEGPLTSIQEAVELAGPGERIEVRPGTYRENNIEITKSIALEGVGRPVIDGENSGTILVIRADDVTIRGFDIRNTGRSYVHDYAAVLVDRSRDVLIEENRLNNVFFGIYLAETEGGSVQYNEIESYDLREATSGNGIHLWNARKPAIVGNLVRGMRDGIYLEFVEDADIRENISNRNNRYGLHYMFSNGGRYAGNTFRNNGAGVAVMYSDNVDMTDNRFEHNWGTSSYGLLLKDMRNSRVERNRFYRNTVAIYSEGSTNILIRHNHIEQNGWAVNIKSSSMRNRFTENNFIENSFDVRTDSPRNHNEFEGNYWSHYEGYDLDGDGIGDVPYRPVRLFSMVVERQPESLILLRSLFIQLLDTAERVMPVLTPQTLFDEKPRMRRME